VVSGKTFVKFLTCNFADERIKQENFFLITYSFVKLLKLKDQVSILLTCACAARYRTNTPLTYLVVFTALVHIVS